MMLLFSFSYFRSPQTSSVLHPRVVKQKGLRREGREGKRREGKGRRGEYTHHTRHPFTLCVTPSRQDVRTGHHLTTSLNQLTFPTSPSHNAPQPHSHYSHTLTTTTPSPQQHPHYSHSPASTTVAHTSTNQLLSSSSGTAASAFRVFATASVSAAVASPGTPVDGR